MFNSNSSAVSGDVNYIEDVFSTYLYTGNGATQTITNGIDLSTEGGLTWIKGRSGATGHRLTDTARGVTKSLESNSTAAEATEATGLTAFGTTGFTIGADADYNTSAATYVSWTFRKQPKFFDVVTYTGTGANRTVAHALGSVPGCIMVKRTDTTGDWQVYHRANTANPETDYLVLNDTAATADSDTRWNDTQPTDAVFSLGTQATVNASGGTYVAYVFAHNAGGFGLTGTDNVISCGSYTTDGSGNATVNLGYEPQWLLRKRSDAASDWILVDNMRGWATSNTNTLAANNADQEFGGGFANQITSTGFSVTSDGASRAYIYIAIRRGPMKVPTDATKVFAPVARTGTSSVVNVTAPNFAPDLLFSRDRNSSVAKFSFNDKLRGPSRSLYSTDTDAEITTTGLTSFNNLGYTAPSDGLSYNESGDPIITECFQRAPSFFDEVCYTGTGSTRTVTHNLVAVPQLIIVKARDNARNWTVYSSATGNTGHLILNNTSAYEANSADWDNTSPTSSVFTVGGNYTVNDLNAGMVAYLFATCPGVSKVGSYTGTGTTQTINCGFTGGARWVMVKRTDSTGDWYVWDSARGIIAGNDPYLLLNSTAAEVTGTDYVDTAASGFELTATAPAAINASGGSFLFLAIA